MDKIIVIVTSMLVPILVVISAVIGIVYHCIIESNKWYKLFKLKGRDDE